LLIRLPLEGKLAFAKQMTDEVFARKRIAIGKRIPEDYTSSVCGFAASTFPSRGRLF